MESQTSDSKKIFKVFDSSKRKKAKKKREDLDDSKSLATDDSNSIALAKVRSVLSHKVSIQDITTAHGDVPPGERATKRDRDRDSSLSESRSPGNKGRRSSISPPRRHRQLHREGISLALKAGRASTPRSNSPAIEVDGSEERKAQDESYIYTFLEDAIKKDKRKHRHSHEKRRTTSGNRTHRHRVHREREDSPIHREREGTPPRNHEKFSKDESAITKTEQTLLLDTFAKLCSQLNEKNNTVRSQQVKVGRTQSHKSLQCEVMPPKESFVMDQRPVRLRSIDQSPSSRVRSHEDISLIRARGRGSDRALEKTYEPHNLKYPCCHQYDQESERYASKLDLAPSRTLNVIHDRRRDYPHNPGPTRSCIDHSSRPHLRSELRDYRDYDDRREPFRDRKHYDDGKRKYIEQKTSRSFDVQRDVYLEDERLCRRTARSDSHKKRYGDPRYDKDKQYEESRECGDKRYDELRGLREKRFDDAREKKYDELRDSHKRYDDFRDSRDKPYDEPCDSRDKRYHDPRDTRDKRYDEPRDSRDRWYDERKDKYYEEKPDTRDRERHSNIHSKDRRWKRNMETFERNSVVSRDEDYRDKERFSERERDSGLSVADGEGSTVSGKSNYLRVVKQEIAEQRDTMDKMMKLWKELMRCFKGISQTQGQDKNAQESAANVQESAAAQLRLWRECMRRYETVARDVGDTDARLMEEINKQRSEMAEMANMWQECLQRYRDMSNDFTSLKKQLATSESPTRGPAPAVVCAEGEGTVPTVPYRMPHNYAAIPQMPPGYAGGGSPLRTRASAPPPGPPAPPAWWWCQEPQSPRRRSSPDSRPSHSRDRHHRRKERDDSRYKDKSSKPSAARSEHRHRKR